MADLHIRLLGQFHVILDGVVVSDFASDKVRALLVYLASEKDHPHRREILAHLLWPDKPESTARGSLRRALANLRKAISDAQAAPPHLLISRQDIQFNPEGGAWIDVDVLTHIYALEKATSENIAQYDEILDLYQGEFLAGFSLQGNLPFDEWVLIKREQYARKMVAILKRASNYYEGLGDFEPALPFAWRHVELAPWKEEARRQLMRLLAYTGRRDEALKQFQDLAAALKSELDVEPESKTRQLYEAIQAGEEEILVNISTQLEDDQPGLPAFLQGEDVTSGTPETFVSRHGELAQLHGYLDAMIEGRGKVALVAGEAGSGKTVLVREFIRQAQTRFPALVSAAGYSNALTGVGDPYLPFREILSQLSGDVEAYWKAGSFSRKFALNLWQVLPLTCQALLRHGPDLVDTLLPGQILLDQVGLYARTKPGWYQELQALVARKHAHPESVQQTNLFSQITAVLKAIAKDVPLLLFLDDLQWADTGTIGMLFQLVKQLSGSRILLVGAYRSEEVSFSDGGSRHPLTPVLHEIKRDYGETVINLDVSPGKEFVDEVVASEPNVLDDAFREQLYDLTGGHALFTVEILRGMTESGALIQDGRGLWGLKPDFHLETLPAKVEGTIAERISRLPENLQHILTLAAIEGEIFTAEIIAAVADLPVTQVVGLLSDQLDRRHRLVRAQQISWQGDQTISTYRFQHFLFQKYLYDRLDAVEQVRYHERVGSEMEALAGEEKQAYAVYLARHFHLANQAEKAVHYYALAGERAFRMSAYPEATKHFEVALQLLLLQPESTTRNEQELSLQLQLGLAYQPMVGFANEKVGQAYQRARELSPDVDDPIKVVTTLHLLLSYYSNMAEFDIGFEIMALLEQNYMELGEEFSDNALLLDWGYGYLDYLLGRIKSAHEHFERAVAHYNPEKHHSLSERLGMEAGIYCHNWAGLHAVWLGYLDQAKTHNQAALKISEHHDSKLFTNDVLYFSAWISLELEDVAAAREYAEALLELTTKEHYFFFEAVARAFKGRVLSREGKHQEAIASIQKALEMFYTTGMVTLQLLFLHALAEAYCAAGRVEEGLDVITKAEQIEVKISEAWNKSSIQKIKGDLYLLQGDETAAEEAYQAAVTTAREQSAKLLELEAVKKLARLWQRQGKVNQANQILQEVYDWFTEGFDTPMLVEARELLEEFAC